MMLLTRFDWCTSSLARSRLFASFIYKFILKLKRIIYALRADFSIIPIANSAEATVGNWQHENNRMKTKATERYVMFTAKVCGVVGVVCDPEKQKRRARETRRHNICIYFTTEAACNSSTVAAAATAFSHRARTVSNGCTLWQGTWMSVYEMAVNSHGASKKVVVTERR